VRAHAGPFVEVHNDEPVVDMFLCVSCIQHDRAAHFTCAAGGAGSRYSRGQGGSSNEGDTCCVLRLQNVIAGVIL
jgi:hypothetical protein